MCTKTDLESDSTYICIIHMTQYQMALSTYIAQCQMMYSTLLIHKTRYSPLGFPFYVKKLFTRNIVTDVTDGYFVVITVVTT
jgi:hypothetical protein